MSTNCHYCGTPIYEDDIDYCGQCGRHGYGLIAALREEIGKVNDALGVIDHCQIVPLFESLREENARLRGWVAQLCERIEEQWPTGTDASTDAAAARKYLATQAPEAKGESGEATELRDALELMVDAAMGSGDATQALSIARALLARPAPAQEQGPETRGADRLAIEVARLIERKVIDSRSPAADALLDYKGGKFFGPPRALLARKSDECPHLWGEDEPCVYPVIKLRHCKLCGVDYTETIATSTGETPEEEFDRIVRNRLSLAEAHARSAQYNSRIAEEIVSDIRNNLQRKAEEGRKS